MNEEFVQDLFDSALRAGVKGDKNSFIARLNSDVEFQQQMLNVAKEEGFKYTDDDFYRFAGIKKKSQTPPSQQPNEPQPSQKNTLETESPSISQSASSSESPLNSEEQQSLSGSISPENNPQADLPPLEREGRSTTFTVKPGSWVSRPKAIDSVPTVDDAKKAQSAVERDAAIRFNKLTSGDITVVEALETRDKTLDFAITNLDMIGVGYMEEYGNDIQDKTLRGEMMDEATVMPPQAAEIAKQKYNAAYKLVDSYPSMINNKAIRKMLNMSPEMLAQIAADKELREQSLEKGEEWIKVYKNDEEAISQANEWTNKKEAAVEYIENMYNIATNVEGQVSYYAQEIQVRKQKLEQLNKELEAAESKDQYDAIQSDFEKTKEETIALSEKINKRVAFLNDYHYQMKEFQKLYEKGNNKFPYEVPDDSPYVVHSTDFVRFIDAAASQSLIGSVVRKALGAEADYTDPSKWSASGVGELGAIALSFVMDAPIFYVGGAGAAKAYQMALRAGKYGRKYVQASDKFNSLVLEIMKRDGLSKALAAKKALEVTSKIDLALIQQMTRLEKYAHSAGSFALYDGFLAYGNGDGTAFDLFKGAAIGAMKGILLTGYGEMVQGAFKNTYQTFATSVDKEAKFMQRFGEKTRNLGAGIAASTVYTAAFVGEGMLFHIMGHLESVAKESLGGEIAPDVTVDDMIESIVSLVGIKAGGMATSYIKAMPHLANKLTDAIRAKKEGEVKETLVDIQKVVEKVVEAIEKEGFEKNKPIDNEAVSVKSEEGAKSEIAVDPTTGKRVIKSYGAKGKIIWEYKDPTPEEVKAVENGSDPQVATEPRLAFVRAKTQQGIFDVLKGQFGLTPDQAETLSAIMYKTFVEMGRRTDKDVLDVMKNISFVRGNEAMMRELMESVPTVSDGVFGVEVKNDTTRNLFKNVLTTSDAPTESQRSAVFTEVISSGKATSEELTRLSRAKNKKRVTVDERVKKVFMAENGAELYDALKEMYGSEKAASEILAKAGIEGVDVKDGDKSTFVATESGVLLQKAINKSLNELANIDIVNGFYSPLEKIINETQFAEKNTELRAQVEKGLPLFQKNSEQALAAVSIAKSGKAIMYAFTGANVTSPLHELAHIFETVLTPQERASILDWAKTPTWSVETSEKFARGWEKYIMEGVAPTTEMQASFDKMSNWFKGVYETLNNSEISLDLRKDIRDIYDSVLGLESDNRAKTYVLTEREKEELAENAPRIEEINKEIDAMRSRSTLFESEKQHLLILREERDNLLNAVERSRKTGAVVDPTAIITKQVPSLTKEEIRVAEKYVNEGDKLTVQEIETFAANKEGIKSYVDVLNVFNDIATGKGIMTPEKNQIYADNHTRINEMLAKHKEAAKKQVGAKRKNNSNAKKADAILSDKAEPRKEETTLDQKAQAEVDLETASARFKERAKEYAEAMQNMGITFDFFSSARADIDLIKDAVDVLRAYVKANKDVVGATDIKNKSYEELLKISPTITKEQFNVLYKLAANANTVEFQLSELRGTAAAKEVGKLKGKNQQLLEKEEVYKELIRTLREKHKDEKDAQRLADKIVRDAKNQLPNNIKTSEFRRILAKASKYVLSGSDTDLGRFAEIMSKVETDVDYAKRLDQALTERDKLLKARKRPNTPFNYLSPLERFLMIDPTELFEHNQGLETAKDMLNEYIGVSKEINEGLKKMRFDSEGNIITPELVPTRNIDAIATRYADLVSDNIFRRLRESKVFLESGLTENDLMRIIEKAKDAAEAVSVIRNQNVAPTPVTVTSVLTAREANRLKIDAQKDVMATLVEMSASGVQGFERFVKENLMYLSQEDLATAHVVVENAIKNGVVAGMGKIESKLLAVENYREVKAMFDSGQVRLRLEGLSATKGYQIFHKIDRMIAGSQTNKTAVLAATGYMDMMSANVKAMNRIDAFTNRMNEERVRLEKLYKDDVFAPEASIAMQIFSHLSQPPKSVRDGVVTKEQWLQNEKDNILHTINTMRERGMEKRADEVEKVYKERLEDIANAEDFILKTAEKEFYDFVVGEHNAILPEYQSIFRYYDNMELVVNPEPYTALSLREATVLDQIETLNRENNVGYNRTLHGNHSGNKIERSFDRGVMDRGNFYDLHFQNVQLNAMKNTVNDAYLRPSVDHVNNFFKMKEVKDMLGTENVTLLTSTMTMQINAEALAREKARFGLDGKATGDKQVALAKAVNSGIKSWRDIINMIFFGNPIFQSVKQATVNLNLFADAVAEGDINIINPFALVSDYNNPAAKGLTKLFPIGMRDIYKATLSDQNVTGLTEKLASQGLQKLGISETEANVKAAQAKEGVETFAYGNPKSAYWLYRNWGLRGIDSSSAKSNWLAYYKAAARKMGLDVNAADFWEKQEANPNMKAATFAESLTVRNHNINQRIMGSEFQQMSGALENMIKITHVPYMSFLLNKKMTILVDMKNAINDVVNAKNSEAARDELKQTIPRLFGHTLEAAAFNTTSVMLGQAVVFEVAKLLRDDDEDDKRIDNPSRYNDMKKMIVTQTITDVTPFLIGDAATKIGVDIVNNLAYKFSSHADNEIDDILKNEFFGKELWYAMGENPLYRPYDGASGSAAEKMLGYYSVALAPFVHMNQAHKLYMASKNGYYTTASGDRRYLNTQDRKDFKTVALFHAAMAIGAPLGEAGKISTQYGKQIKRYSSYSNQIERLIGTKVVYANDSDVAKEVKRLNTPIKDYNYTPETFMQFQLGGFDINLSPLQNGLTKDSTIGIVDLLNDKSISEELDEILASDEYKYKFAGGVMSLEQQINSSVIKQSVNKLLPWNPSDHFKKMDFMLGTEGNGKTAGYYAAEYYKKLPVEKRADYVMALKFNLFVVGVASDEVSAVAISEFYRLTGEK